MAWLLVKYYQTNKIKTMKKGNYILGGRKKAILLLLALIVVKVGISQNSIKNTESFGISYSYESSKILNDRMFIKGNYTLGRRSFEAGISLNSYSPDTQGFLFQHKVFLNKKKNEHAEFNIKDYNIRTFAIYKFIMFGSSTNSLRKKPEIKSSDGVMPQSLTNANINTIEHYIGFGVEFKLYKNFFIEMMGVGGINIIKNNSQAVIIKDTIVPKSDAGFSWDFTLSMNYNF
jgi:hypothetical protein